MSIELLDLLKQQTDNLSPQEKSVLVNYLLEQTLSAPKRSGGPWRNKPSEHKRQQRMDWMKANQAEYGGQYVVLDGGELVGTGRSYREASELARASGLNDLFVTYLPKPDEFGYMGGW